MILEACVCVCVLLLGCNNSFSKLKQVVKISAQPLQYSLSRMHMETQRQRHTRTHAGLISMCDYAWHVQSGSGDVINLFQQETDAWMSHTNTHTVTHTLRHTHVCCQGNKANVTVSRKQSPKSAAWHSVIIPPHAYLHSGLRIRLGATVSTPCCTSLHQPPLLPSSLLSIYLLAFHFIHLVPSAISPSAPSFTRLLKLSPCSDSSVYYQWIVHGLAWQLP